YTLPAQINYRNYTGSGDSRYDFSVLNLGDNNVKNFAYAMYSDIAAFFKYYAGSTDFNIGADEVALTSTDVWTYTDFINYVNQVNAVLKSKGYKTRMYNDFLYNTNYTTNTTGIDSDIEVVYWLPTTSSRTYLRSASFYANQGRNLYSGVNFWTYYVLRIAPTSTATHMDARDPSNRQWEFYRNQEDHLYNEWNASQMGAYTDANMGSSNNYSGDKLAGAYFMIWNDFAGLNTEVEVWNGCTDVYGKYSNGSYSGYGYYYSMIERMWSSGIKQWNADINNTLTFANFETLRDKMGFFPGYVATPSTQAYANGMVLAEPTAVSDNPFRTSYTVTFINYDGTVIDTQEVKEGFAAVAPAVTLTKPSDVWYDYTFSGWDKDFTNITTDTVVIAQYSGKATTAGKIGYLDVKVTGGTNFTMSVDGSAAKPMGIEYVNPSMEFGKAVTLTAQTTNGNSFIGWMDAKTGDMLTTSATYSFFTSGNDVLVALYSTDIPGGGLVTFRNDKTNQVIEIQYYYAEDTIEFPADLSYPGYEFTGWQYTEAEIKAMLSEGKDVTVNAVWQSKDVYFEIVVNGGYIAESGGSSGNSYIGYKGTTVKATPAENEKFAYWMDEEGNVVSYSEEYKFYPYKNTELTAVFISKIGSKVDIVGIKPIPEAGTETPEQKETFTVYFENNWLWNDVRIHYFYDNNASLNTSWPGVPMNFHEKNGTYDVYTFEVPIGVSGFLFTGIKNDGSGALDQSPDIRTDFVDGRQYSMTWDNGNKVVTNDNRVQSDTTSEPTVYSFLYIYIPEGLLAENEWFAAHVWETDNTSSDMWFEVVRVADGIYKAKVPEKYAGIEIFKMVSPVGVFDTTGSKSLLSGSIHPDDEQNTVVYNADGSHNGYTNIHEMFFVNEMNWDTIEVYYTDAFGTHKVELEFVETDENGKDAYLMHLPENAIELVFTNGSESYTYVPSGNLAYRTLFGFVPAIIDPEVDKDITVNVGTDTESLGDSTVVIFDWSVLAETGYDFVNAGVLLVKEEDYIEATFVKGTIDPKVIQFTPSKKYQLATGVHSVTIPQVEVGDAWIACAFVQYRDEQGNLKTKYSKQVTGKK
ncbi:MAG: starch-binding protein, partial [Ruminococcus sp.]|nr:starch-binding protein [Ruminococcus sp.]